MSIYIKREAVIKEIEKVFCTNCTSYNGVMCKCCDHADDLDYINEAPTADVQPVKHGYWTAENTRPKSVMYRCSVCRQIAYDKPLGSKRHYVKQKCSLAFCPHCGAKMDGGEKQW